MATWAGYGVLYGFTETPVLQWMAHTGKFTLGAAPQCVDVRGGVLADEMGLGKTAEVSMCGVNHTGLCICRRHTKCRCVDHTGLCMIYRHTERTCVNHTRLCMCRTHTECVFVDHTGLCV